MNIKAAILQIQICLFFWFAVYILEALEVSKVWRTTVRRLLHEGALPQSVLSDAQSHHESRSRACRRVQWCAPGSPRRASLGRARGLIQHLSRSAPCACLWHAWLAGGCDFLWRGCASYVIRAIACHVCPMSRTRYGTCRVRARCVVLRNLLLDSRRQPRALIRGPRRRLLVSTAEASLVQAPWWMTLEGSHQWLCEEMGLQQRSSRGTGVKALPDGLPSVFCAGCYVHLRGCDAFCRALS